MLIDISRIAPDPSNMAIEFLCRSVEDAQLFEPHPLEPFLGAVEDLCMAWMVDRLKGLQRQALWIFTGEGRLLHKANEDLDQHCKHLEAQVKDAIPGTLPMQTYLEIVDCLMHQYLPVALLENQAKREAVRQYMAGQVRRRQPPRHGSPLDVAEALPLTVTAAIRTHRLHPQDQARIQVAQASAARYVRDLSESARSRMQQIILDAERRRVGSGETRYAPQPLQQALLDHFGELNRDLRRLAVTETAINAADGFIAGAKDGDRVRWLTHRGACEACRSMNGRVFTVVSSQARDKDADTQIWVGKLEMNIGRSLAKRKRTEQGLQDRSEDELVKPVIPLHPGCHCLWVHHVEVPHQATRARATDETR